MQINKAGWKAQDKANLDAQVEAEREKIAAMRREIITPAMVIEEAKAVELSNDRIMRLGEERLELHVKLAQISRAVFWKDEIAIPERVLPYQHVM